MKQEDKDLLLKDLCARLPYGVICQIYDPQQDYGEDIFDARLIHIDAWTFHCYFWGCSETDPYKIEQVKPYLRPLSSMTEEEKREYKHLIAFSGNPIGSANLIDWLNKKMFACRTIDDKDDKDMFELGLAIKVTEYNNPYD